MIATGLMLPPHLWLLTLACLLALTALWWFTLGVRRFARWRALRGRLDALACGDRQPVGSGVGIDAGSGAGARFESGHDPTTRGPGAPASPTKTERRALHDAISTAADRLLAGTAAVAPIERLYLAPWFLFLGDAQAGVADLLGGFAASADEGRRSKDPADDPGFWRWHLLARMTAIETTPELIDAPAGATAPVLWYEALLALAEQRERLPLNGLVLCVAATTLHRCGPTLGVALERLSDRMDDVLELLRVQLPVYLVVTGLERLQGFDTFRAALPEPGLLQALGHRFALPATRQPDAREATRAIENIASGLHALRLGMLREARSSRERNDIHVFVEQLLAVMPALEAAQRILFGPGREHRPAPWRGVYFTGASPDVPRGVFVGDLLDTLLPADQPLARP